MAGNVIHELGIFEKQVCLHGVDCFCWMNERWLNNHGVAVTAVQSSMFFQAKTGRSTVTGNLFLCVGVELLPDCVEL